MKPKKVQVEICVASLTEAINASKFPIDRVEVCSALDVGGVTPSRALIRTCVDLRLETHVLIRPRPGGFEYSDEEKKQIRDEIKDARDAGAHGVVVGALRGGHIDYKFSNEMVEQARALGFAITFHRAFDFVIDQFNALDQLIELGFDRVLTSGGSRSAFEGRDQIARLAGHAAGRIQIMAGAGVSPANVQEIVSTGVDAVHFSARKVIRSIDGMGDEVEVDEEKVGKVLKRILD